jgi:iron complex outermembrane receptor protein
MGPPPPVYALSETLPFASELEAFNTNELFRAAIGVEGDFSNNWSWLVDSSVAYSDVENGVRDPLTALYPLALAGMGGANCDPASAAGEGDCYYYNPFMSSALPNASSLQAGSGPGLAQNGLANDPEMLNWLIPNRIERFFGEFFSFDFRITGEFGELPGGPIGVAFGVAYREESIERDADASSNAGTTATIGVVNDFKGKQAVDSQYFEFALPVHEDVIIQIAARNESYDGGFSELSPKVAALWTPNDRLTLRASFGNSFKGPSISQTAAATTFQGGAPRILTFENVAYGEGMGINRASFTTLPNPDLKPQTSDNLSVGFDFDVSDRITVGASYVAIDFEDRIVAPTANVASLNLSCNILNPDGTPATVGPGAMSSRLWKSVADGGCIVPINPAFPIDNDNIGLIVSTPTNLGFLNTEYLDLRANMSFDTPIGQLTFSPSVALVLTYEFPLPDGTSADALCPGGLCSSIARNIGMGFSNGINSIPRWQGNFPVTISYGDHRFRLNTIYRDGLNSEVGDLNPTAPATANFVHEEGQWQFDVQWNWQITPKTSLGLASQNLFATEPPAQQAARFNRRNREYVLTFRHSFNN